MKSYHMTVFLCAGKRVVRFFRNRKYGEGSRDITGSGHDGIRVPAGHAELPFRLFPAALLCEYYVAELLRPGSL